MDRQRAGEGRGAERVRESGKEGEHREIGRESRESRKRKREIERERIERAERAERAEREIGGKTERVCARACVFMRVHVGWVSCWGCTCVSNLLANVPHNCRA